MLRPNDRCRRLKLRSPISRCGSPSSISACLAHCEREIVEAAMRQVDYKQSQAARLLGLTPRSIYNKLRKYHLSRGENPLS